MSQRLLFHRICIIAFFQVILSTSILYSQNNLQVDFTSTTIDTNVVYKGMKANFPYPVLSLLTVRDQNGRYIHGLADTTKWLTPADTNQLGDLVDDVWETIFEYHQEDMNLPPNPDVKAGTPSYLVREVLDLQGYNTSMAMVMDYSGSMNDDIYIAEDGARNFFRQISPLDRIALIKFTGKIEVFQEFTSDTTLLMEALESPTSDRHVTAFYDAVYLGLEACESEPGRRVVIAYTDGNDNASGHSLNDVIEYAQDLDIPVYVIGLGLAVDNNALNNLAVQTGGTYITTTNVEDLQGIYEEIYEEVRGFYMLAHNSTDPDPDGTYRIVDLTVHHENASGNGKGRYYVPFIGPDLDVNKVVMASDRVTPISSAIAGDSVSYKISVYNHANGPANGVKIVDRLPDSLTVYEIVPAPDIFTQDSLIWNLNRMEAGDSLIITYRALISEKLGLDTLILSNEVTAYTPDDANLTNNVVASRLSVHGLGDIAARVLVPAYAYSPDYPADLTGYISNVGSVDINYPFQVSFKINGSTIVATDTIAFLAVGDSVLTRGIWDSPAEGVYSLEIHADYLFEIPETDENNNKDNDQIQVAITGLKMQVSDVNLDDELFFKQASFPDPILSSVSIVDQNINPVHKLASTSSWIDMNANTDLNVQATQIWQRMKEFHQNDPSMPPFSDVKSGLEVYEQKNDAFSVALLIDFSINMSWLKKSVSNYIGTWTRSDGGAVVSAKDNTLMQSFTQDPSLLKSAVSSIYNSTTRRLYDGLYTAVNSVSNQEGRNAVIGFAGGADNSTAHHIAGVAERALYKNVPVYIVELAGAASDSLKWLTERTGGWYWLISDSSEFRPVVQSLDRVLRNYYLTAHTSSDTLKNNTWRAIDLQVSAHAFTDADTGYYHTPIGYTDVEVVKKAFSSHFTVVGNDTIYRASPGDTVYYSIQINNVGHYVIPQFDVVDVLPDGLSFMRSTPSSAAVHQDSIVWEIFNLGVNGSRTINYQCLVDTLRLPNSFYMLNQAFVDLPADTVQDNNVGQDSVLFVPLGPADLSIKKYVQGDSSVVTGSDTTWYSDAGDTVQYNIHITNIGDLNARDVEIQDVLPDYLTLINAVPTPNVVLGDTLRWQIPLITGSNGFYSIQYTCKVDTTMPPWNTTLVNHAMVSSPDDTLNNNDTIQDTLWVTGLIPPGPEVIASPALISPGDSVDITVMAPYEVQSWDVVLIFEDGSQVTTYGDAFIQATTLSPGLPTLMVPPFADTYFTVPKSDEWVQVIFITTDVWNVQRSDTAYFRIGATDLEIQKKAASDSSQVINNDTTYYAQPKDTVQYQITVKNVGWHTAFNIDVSDTYSNGLSFLDASLLPSLTVGNTVEWHLDSIQVGQSQVITYQCTVDTLRIPGPIELINLATIYCPEDTINDNNTTGDTLTYLPLIPVDLTVSKTGVGDSLSVTGQDSIWYVHPGRTVEYTIKIRNIGQIVCSGAEIYDIMPDYLTFISSTPLLHRQNGDTLFWQIGKVPERGGMTQIQYTCHVDSSMPHYSVPLVNYVFSDCPEDTITQNNTTADTVWVIGIKPPGPIIQLDPVLVSPTDTVGVRVMSPIDVISWDLEVIYADHSISEDYGDAFINSNSLIANQWLTVDPSFDDTQMRLNETSETVYMILKTTDSWGLVQTDTASFQIQSADEFFLDRNVFKPHESPIRVRVQLSSNRNASLAIYDISGAKYHQLIDDEFLSAGWHYYDWDGYDESGNPAGSGIYVVILHTGTFNKALKFILVR